MIKYLTDDKPSSSYRLRCSSCSRSAIIFHGDYIKKKKESRLPTSSFMQLTENYSYLMNKSCLEKKKCERDASVSSLFTSADSIDFSRELADRFSQ